MYNETSIKHREQYLLNIIKPGDQMSNIIYLSSPHMSGQEMSYIQQAFDTNWIAPLGPNVTAFEEEFGNAVGTKHALALSSGTAAIHLALILSGVQPGDSVLVSTLTFSASVNPIVYLGAKPVFVDSERTSWNMDPELLATYLKNCSKDEIPRAMVLVHLYGQCADIEPIQELCQQYGIVLIEDAAEALGATYKGKSPGTFGRFGIFSFNGNKIITTSGGGMLISDDESLIAHAFKLATQARDEAPHYQHSEIGYNYRMSNVLAGIGRGQLPVLAQRVAARRRNFAFYQQHLADLPGIELQPEAPWGLHTRWLTCLTIDPNRFGVDREAICQALNANNIESRPVWKPMHMQPVFQSYKAIGGQVAEDLFNRGLCLPSGSNLEEHDLQRVVDVIRNLT
jgi:pyridoxal phosphate-dependent aminotransferase EpsN